MEVNTTLLNTYWQIGKIIVEDEAMHIGDSEYVVYMPDKEQLIQQVEAVLEKWHEEKES